VRPAHWRLPVGATSRSSSVSARTPGGMHPAAERESILRLRREGCRGRHRGGAACPATACTVPKQPCTPHGGWTSEKVAQSPRPFPKRARGHEVLSSSTRYSSMHYSIKVHAALRVRYSAPPSPAQIFRMVAPSLARTLSRLLSALWQPPEASAKFAALVS
jgi:hypothetical protein